MDDVAIRLHSLDNHINKAQIYSKCQKIGETHRKMLPVINQSFFFGCKVKVCMNNYIQNVFISNTLRNYGAIILEDSSLTPDITIVDNIFNVNLDKTKSGLIIDLQQIPWVNQSQITNEEKPAKKYIVVVDSNHQKRPKYKKMNCLPQIYLKNSSTHYFASPFLTESECAHETSSNKKNEPKKDSEPVVDHSNPPNCGYCEICMCNFQDAENHRCSKEHSFKTDKNDIFTELDILIKQINEKDLIC